MDRSTSDWSRRFFLGALASGCASATHAELLVSPLPVARPLNLGRSSAASEALIKKAGLGGKTTFAVADAKTGEFLESRSHLYAQPPASVAKALTAIYGLRTLGPNHRFATRLVATGSVSAGKIEGDLILEGSGDPLLDTDRLGEMAKQLREAGIFEVAGQFHVLDTALPAIGSIDPSQPDHVGYNPSISGLNLNFNRVYFEWKRGNPDYAITLDARAKRHRPRVTVSRMQVVDRSMPIYTYADGAGRDEWTVARKALGKEGGRWLPVRYPAHYATEVMTSLLRSNGIEVKSGEPLVASEPGIELVVSEGPELLQLLRGMLKYSTNLTAEVVGLSATKARGMAPATLAESGSAMSDWLVSEFDARRPQLVDHSGLGDASRITSYDMVRALMEAGPETGIRDLMKNVSLRDANGSTIKNHPVKVSAKTGTLNFVSGLAGFITTAEGRELVFAIFSSDMDRRERLSKAERERPPGGKQWARGARRLQNKLIQQWATAYIS